MFVDKIVITCKAGEGGNGCASFLRDKFTMLGGPDGGDGGRGGDVYFICGDKQNTLIDFYYKKKFFAGNGGSGQKLNKHGKKGDDIIIEVPVGTIVKNVKTGEIIADLCEIGTKFKLLRGGNGGRGNAQFTSSTRQAPNFSELGEKTEVFEFLLELKYIADVGLIGFPNVGKSTILSVVSGAKPKIANYHFTTLSPNLGVVKYYDKSFVVADIPGLIEGASTGVGLGHDFLKHIERTRLLVNVVDASGQEGRDPISDIAVINNELKLFSPCLSKIPQIVVLNKCDLIEDTASISAKIINSKKIKTLDVVTVSAATRAGIENLIKTIAQHLALLPKENFQYISDKQVDERDRQSVNISRRDDGAFVLEGGYIETMKRKIVLDDYQSFSYFQRRLKEDGIIDMLKARGVKEGSTIVIGDKEFEYLE